MGERKIQDNLLKDVVAQVDVFTYMSVQDFLKTIYNELKTRLPRYSYRAFAADLGFGETNYLHLICTHKRQLSPRSAQQVVHHLGLQAERRQWFLSLVEHNGARSVERRTAGIRRAFEIRQKTLQNDLTRDEMEFFSKWYHPVVRELAGKKNFSSDPHWISAHVRPRITPEQAKNSVELLLRLGYLTQSDDSKLSMTHSTIRVPEGASHLSIHSYHQEMLQLSARSLSEIEPEERDISALTVSLSAEQIVHVKKMMRDLRESIIQMGEENIDKYEIYQLNMQLFPLTRDET